MKAVSLSSTSDDRIAWIQPPRVVVDEAIVSDEGSLEEGESAEDSNADEEASSTSEDS